jgi:hypothetical protein
MSNGVQCEVTDVCANPGIGPVGVFVSNDVSDAVEDGEVPSNEGS